MAMVIPCRSFLRGNKFLTPALIFCYSNLEPTAYKRKKYTSCYTK